MIEPGKVRCDRCGAEIKGYYSNRTFDLNMWENLFGDLDSFSKSEKEKQKSKLLNRPDLCPYCKEKWNKLMLLQVKQRMRFMGIKELKDGA